MWEEKVTIEGPYHFDLALSRLALDPVNTVDTVKRSIKVPIYEQSYEVAHVQAVGSVDQPAFLVTGKNERTKREVMNRVSNIFQWGVSLKEVNAHFKNTVLEPLFKCHRGTPIVLDFSPYITLLKSIIHQQVNMKFAFSLTERFVENFGFTIDGVPFYPRAEKVAELHPDSLRALQFSQRKAEYIIGIAKLIQEEELKLVDLKSLSDEEVMEELVKIRGVGPWTAQSFLLFGLGRKNLFPFADIGLQNALKKMYKLERKPTIEEMKRYTEQWHPFLSYASLYLWRSIES